MLLGWGRGEEMEIFLAIDRKIVVISRRSMFLRGFVELILMEVWGRDQQLHVSQSAVSATLAVEDSVDLGCCN